MTPFKVLSSYEASTFVDLVFSDSRAPKAPEWAKENQDILRHLRIIFRLHGNSEKNMLITIELRGLLRWATW